MSVIRSVILENLRNLPAIFIGLVLAIPVLAQDEVLEIRDSASFSIDGNGQLWGPESGFSQHAFKEDILNIPRQSGTLGVVWGGEIELEKASHVGDPTYLCPSDQVFVVDGCYAKCPAGSTQIGNICTSNVESTDEGPYGCFSGERDNLLGSCYACPAGHYRDALGFCRDDASRINEGGASVSYSCPSGYSTDWFTAGIQCSKRSCPSGYSGNSGGTILLGTECKKTGSSHEHCVLFICDSHRHTSYKNKTTSYADPSVTFGCNWGGGEWLYGDTCYTCPTGYSNNGIGGCTKTSADAYAHEFYCPADEWENLLTGRCFSCPAGYDDDGFGNCDKQTTVAKVSDVTLLCPVGQFPSSPLEGFLITGSASLPQCYQCLNDYDHNPVFGVNDSGVCFKLDFQPNRPNATYQLGLEADYDFHFRWGLEGGITLDPGSVAVDYDATVEIELERPPEEPGPELITLRTKQIPSLSSISMATTWPSIDMYIDTYVDAATSLSGTAVYPEVTVEGILTHEDSFTLFDQTTDGEQSPDPDFPLAEFHIGLDGFNLKVVGDPVGGFTGGLDPPIELAYPIAKTPAGIIELGFVVAEIGVVTPDMFTPARTSPPYDGIHGTESNLTDSGSSTFVRNYIKPGPRAGVDFGILTTSAQDPDIGRIDIDLDGIYALTSGQALGVKIKQPTPVPLVNFWSISASALDLDGGMIFSMQEDFKFEPNLAVELRFSKPTEVETIPGSGIYITTTTRTVGVGQDIQFFHPGGDLYIDTVYSVADNTFTNNTDLVLTPLVEGQVVALNYEFLGRPSALPNRLAALQLTQDLSPNPILLSHINFFDDEEESVFPLTGFVDSSGSTLMVVGRNEPPVAVCSDITVELDVNGHVTLLAELFDGGSTDPDLVKGDHITFTLDTYQASCTDIGAMTVQLTVTDDSGESDSCLAVATIVDTTNPLAEANGPYSGIEGGVLNLTATGSSDACGPISYGWDFGDQGAGEGSDPAHQYCDDGSLSVILTVTDSNGNGGTDTALVTINNVAPAFNAGQDIQILEGSFAALTGAVFSDPGSDIHTSQVQWTTGSTVLGSVVQLDDAVGCGTSGTISSSYRFMDNGTSVVLVTVDDGDGGITSDTVTVAVENVAPTVNAGSDKSILEGSSISFNGSFTDPGADTHDLHWDFGDGSTADGDLTPEHRYLDNGTYTVTLTVTDDDGGVGDDTIQIEVANVAPIIDPLEAVSIYSGQSLDLIATFADPGVLDTHIAEVNWGDGSAIEAGSVTEISGAGNITEDHVYYLPGDYSVIVKVVDKDGGTHSTGLNLEVTRLPVVIDVKPDNDDNVVNPGSNGVLPAAIITTQDFDATTVIPGTLTLGNSSIKHDGHVDDVNDDAFVDLVLHFKTADLGLDPGDEKLVLLGETVNGRYIIGEDIITQVGSGSDPIGSDDDSPDPDDDSGKGKGKGKG